MNFILNTLHIQNDGASENDCNCIIHETFYGKLASTVICDNCKNAYTKVDPYMDLSLDVRNQAKKRKLDPHVKEEASLGLRDCLERFTTREKLSGDYTCPSCEEKQSATKQFSIKSLPPFLPIHLKRFDYSKSASSKIETRVSFPMKLDLFPYTTQYKSGQTKASKLNGPPNANHNMNTPANSHMYELASVIVHKGKMDSGHYVSYSREENEWFLFDDSKVVLVPEADVLAAEAYILFYMVSGMET
jgi:ubiquitin carboxyl-terminal hydrolase 22/27/51